MGDFRVKTCYNNIRETEVMIMRDSLEEILRRNR